MKTVNVLLAASICLALAGIAAAQDTAAERNATNTTSSDQLPPVRPPPDMDDKDPVTNVPTPQAVAKSVVNNSTATDSTNSDTAARAAANSPGLPPDVQAAADASELPVITVRQDGSDTVEEYRKKGKLYFVRVLSTNGPTKLYVDNTNDIPHDVMQQMSGPSGVVQPVYYKLLDWK
jgi:Protein of unknown function (DUF2782)